MIRMTKAVWDDIIDHAWKDYPIEACGYLGVADGIVTSCYRMKNTDNSGEHYTLDPGEQFTVIRDMRKSGVKLAAVYHSHPASPARPSQEDIRLAYDPDISYVIISLNGNDKSVKSFQIRDNQVAPESIEVVVFDTGTVKVVGQI